MSQHPQDKKREDDRPDPEALLDRYGLRDSDMEDSSPEEAREESSQADRYPHKRGRLRIYLAAVAGAGKTYAMLNEGHRREGRGASVVIGYVETHRRSQTEAQIGDLEVMPRKQVTYRGVTLEEMDIDEIIARHPNVALVDELAHTNAPGSKYVKRYQDVEELLDAGINVVTTLNIPVSYTHLT